MSDFFFLFLVVIFFVAVFVREDFVFLLLYLLLGAFVLGRLWGRRGLEGIKTRRTFTQRAFLGEKIQVEVEIENGGLLPLAWLQVRESLPISLHSGGLFQQVITLRPKGLQKFEYMLDCRRRGYYSIGPLDLFSSDVLGVSGTQKYQAEPDHLTVFPKIIPLTKVVLPSQAPLGTLRHHRPIFEDPSRVLGKRDYIAGDSLRRVDWKATATVGRMQVRLFEPSIALETAIFLNLNRDEYNHRVRLDATELAIIAAASIANWIISVRQSVGLVTNGGDPILGFDCPPSISPRRGRGHLLRILEILARIQVVESIPLVQLLQNESATLSWGTTMILITNQADEALFDGLFNARRSGLNVFLILCGPVKKYNEVQRRAAYFSFPVHHLLNERDMDVWRQ